MRLGSGVATGDEGWQASTLTIRSVVELQLRYKLNTTKFALIEVLKFLFCRKKGVELELSDGKVESLSQITEIEVGIISQYHTIMKRLRSSLFLVMTTYLLKSARVKVITPKKSIALQCLGCRLLHITQLLELS